MPQRQSMVSGPGPLGAGRVYDVSGMHLWAITASGGVWTLAGLTGGVDAQWLLIRNGGAYVMTIAHGDVSAAATARIYTSSGSAVDCAAGASALLVYDALLPGWVLHSVA